MTLAAAVLALLLPLSPAPFGDGPLDETVIPVPNAREEAVPTPLPNAPIPPAEAAGFDL